MTTKQKNRANIGWLPSLFLLLTMAESQVVYDHHYRRQPIRLVGSQPCPSFALNATNPKMVNISEVSVSFWVRDKTLADFGGESFFMVENNMNEKYVFLHDSGQSEPTIENVSQNFVKCTYAKDLTNDGWLKIQFRITFDPANNSFLLELFENGNLHPFDIPTMVDSLTSFFFGFGSESQDVHSCQR